MNCIHRGGRGGLALGNANRKKGRCSDGGGKAHLGATVDGLSEPDVLLGLGASEPVLLGDALGVGVDAGLAGGEVAEDLDGVVHAALVGVDPVESCQEKQGGGGTTNHQGAARGAPFPMEWSRPATS